MEKLSSILAHALLDSGAEVITFVPTSGATQVFDALNELGGNRFVVSFNEEPAITISHGASIVGKRSAALIKSHGLAKGANSIVDALAVDLTAGMVVVIFEDKSGSHSDSIFDVGALLEGLKIPYCVPKKEELYREIMQSFVRSETYGIPVAVWVDSDDLAEELPYTPASIPAPSGHYERNIVKHAASPFLTQHQYHVSNVKRSMLDEQWRSIPHPVLPHMPAGLSPAWEAIIRTYHTLFEVFKQVRGEIVCGDAGGSGLFAYPPYDCLDIVTFMGGSVSLAAGAALAGYEKVWAVTGDFAFVSAGHLGLIEAVQRKLPLKVLILNNGKSQATGGQVIPDGVFEDLLKGYERFILRIHNPQDAQEIRKVLSAAHDADELRIVIANYQ